MSLEEAIAKLTAAVEANTAAIQGAGTTTKAAAAKTETRKAGSADGPGYWKTEDETEVGAYQNKAEFDAAQEANEQTIIEINKTEYNKLKSAIEKSEAAEKAEKEKKAAADKKAAAEKKKAEAAAAKKAEEDAESADEGNEYTQDDLLEAFSAYLPKTLDKEERAARAPAIKKFLSSKGARVVRDLDPADYAEAIEFVNGLMAELKEDDAEEDDEEDLV